jgi:hypothetical protein
MLSRKHPALRRACAPASRGGAPAGHERSPAKEAHRETRQPRRHTNKGSAGAAAASDDGVFCKGACIGFFGAPSQRMILTVQGQKVRPTLKVLCDAAPLAGLGSPALHRSQQHAAARAPAALLASVGAWPRMI